MLHIEIALAVGWRGGWAIGWRGAHQARQWIDLMERKEELARCRRMLTLMLTLNIPGPHTAHVRVTVSRPDVYVNPTERVSSTSSFACVGTWVTAERASLWGATRGTR